MKNGECVNEERESIVEERECATHAKNVLTSFEGMKNDGQFCDFILTIGKEEISVHRMVLAACSTYFQAIFLHDTEETKTGRAEILDIEPSAGKQCLEFVYTGKIKFSQENPKDLINAAEVMQLHSLIKLYLEYLVEKISIKNYLEYMALALTYNQQSFAEMFKKFLTENFAEIVQSEDFSSMSQALLLQCLDSLPDGIQSLEKLKWEAVTTWVKAELEIRDTVFPELFKKLKLENLPLEFVKETIAKEPLVVESNICKVHSFDGFRALELSAASGPGRHLTHVFAYHKESRLLQKYDLITKKWSRFTRVPTSISNGTDVFDSDFTDHSVSSDQLWNGSFVDAIGSNENIYAGTGNQLWKFCADSPANWQDLLPKRSYENIRFCRCAISYPYVYMVTKDRVCKYNIGNGKLIDIQTKLDLNAGYAICASDDFLYAIEGSGTQRRAREFDMKASNPAWEPISSMKYGRINGAAVVFKGKLLALGGYYYNDNNANSRQINTIIEFYEPIVDRWMAFPYRSYSCLDFKPFIMKDELYVVENDTMTIKKIELY